MGFRARSVPLWTYGNPGEVNDGQNSIEPTWPNNTKKPAKSAGAKS